MTTVYVLVRDAPSEDRCTVTTPLAVYTSYSAAKRERSRLNRLRAEEVATRAVRLIGREYFKPVGQASLAYATHTEASATTYAGYEVPTIRLVEVVCDDEVPNGAEVFRGERWRS